MKKRPSKDQNYTYTWYLLFRSYMEVRGLWRRFKILMFLRYGIFNYKKHCVERILSPEYFIAAFPLVLLHNRGKDFLKLNLSWQTFYYETDKGKKFIRDRK